MSFSSFKEQKTKEELQVEIRVLENSITDDMAKGDKKIIENRINKLKGQMELQDSTVAGDIAMATNNLMTDCKGEAGCDCQKCKLLKRDPIAEAVQDSLNFGNFFGN